MQSPLTQLSQRIDGEPAVFSAAESVISVRDLRMTYGATEAVRGIDLEVRRGEIFAFLGPNGAGKTTTVEILEGFRRRTAGDVRVLGEDPDIAGSGWRARLGMVLQDSQPEVGLSVQECLSLYAGYYPAPRPVAATLELVGLADRRGALCQTLSGGQRRRLDVAIALIGDPELLFLDEPTTGFDPAARRAAWQIIENLRGLGKSVFLTTHYLDEADHLADRLAIIADGQIVAEGTPESLGGRGVTEAQIRFTLPSGLTVSDLPSSLTAWEPAHSGRQVLLHTPQPLPQLATLASWASERNIDLPDLEVVRPSLEDVYLKLTGGNLR